MKTRTHIPSALLVLAVGFLSSASMAQENQKKEEPLQRITLLGIETSRVSDALRNQVDIPDGVGLTISHVAEDTGADKAGLRKYDILLKVDDQIIINQEQLSTYIRSKKPGDKVSAEILRKGKKQTLPVELGEGKVPKYQKFGPNRTLPDPSKPPFGDWNFNFNSEEFQKRMEEIAENAAEMGNKALQFIPQIMIEREESDGSKRITSVGRGPHRIMISKDDLTAKVETTNGEKKYQVSRKQTGKEEEILYEGDEPTEETLGKLPEEARQLIKRLQDSDGFKLEDLKNENIRVIINTGEEEARLLNEPADQDA